MTARILATLFTFCLLLPVGAAPDLPLRINSGGPEIKQVDQHWQAGSRYVKSGADFGFPGNHDLSLAKGAGPAAVYNSVRHRDHSYHVADLPDGRYLVRLHFVDSYDQGGRAMDYTVGGVKVLENFDVVSAAGAPSRAYVVEFVAEAAGSNGLLITASRGKGNDVFEAGIEILEAPAGAAPASGPLKIAKAAPDEAGPQPSPKELAARLEKLAGGQVRLVWTRVQNEHDTCAKQGGGELWGLDTKGDELGRERRILSLQRSYAKPMITPDGSRIVFTDQEKQRCYVVGWDGKELRDVAPGFATDIWVDPSSGREWVYVRQSFSATNGAIVRHPMDGKGEGELVWNQAPVGHDLVPWFQLSPDGQFAGGAFPWPKCGVADLKAGTWRPYGSGCWTSIAPDNSHRYFQFLGSHTEMVMYDKGGASPRTMRVNGMAGMRGRKVYHPRWSNHPRLLTVTGPQHSHEVELYIGRFNTAITAVESWERVTYNSRADFFGDAWIAPGSTLAVASPSPAAGSVEPVKAAPIDPHELIFLWDKKKATNQVPNRAGGPPLVSKLQLHGSAIFNRHGGLSLRGGAAEIDAESTKRIIAACKESNAMTIEAIVRAPHGNYPFPHRILSISKGLQRRNVTLAQRGGNWVIRLRTTENRENADNPEIILGPATPGKDQHILVTYTKADMRCYLDGQTTAPSAAINGTFANWADDHFMVLGDEYLGQRNWAGELEGVAMWARALDPVEAATRAAAAKERLAARPALPPVLAIEAELLASAKPATAKDRGTYTRSLTEGHFRVKKVLEGKLDAKEINVVRWSILAGQPIAAGEPKVGDTLTLYLEPWAANPQLHGEHRMVLESADVELLPQFYHDTR